VGHGYRQVGRRVVGIGRGVVAGIGIQPERRGHRGGVCDRAGGRRADQGDRGGGGGGAREQGGRGGGVGGAAGPAPPWPGRGNGRPRGGGDDRRGQVAHLRADGRARPVVGDHDDVGVGRARHDGGRAVGDGDLQVGPGREVVGVGERVVARAGVGRPSRRGHRGGVGERTGRGRVGRGGGAEGGGGVDRE